MKITCGLWRKDLLKALSETLPERRRRGLDRHLSRCPRCREEQRQLLAVVADLEGSAPAYLGPSPEADAQCVKAALRQAILEDRRRHVPSPRRRHVPVAAWVTLGAVAGLCLGLIGARRFGFRGAARAPYQVQGSVLQDASGSPAAGSLVAAFTKEDFETNVLPALGEGREWTTPPVAHAYANHEGQFSLPLMNPGTYYVVCLPGHKGEPARYQLVSATADPARERRVELVLAGSPDRSSGGSQRGPASVPAGEGGVIRGRVLMADRKTPADGVMVIVYQAGRGFAGADFTLQPVGLPTIRVRSRPLALADQQGRYEVEGLPAGDYGIVALPRGFRTTSLDAKGRYELLGDAEAEPVRVRPGTALTEPDLILPSAGVLVVSAQRAGGRGPAADLAVWLRPAALPPAGAFIEASRSESGQTRTDHTGACRFPGLTPGRYSLSYYEPGGGGPRQQPVRIAPAEETPVTIQVP